MTDSSEAAGIPGPEAGGAAVNGPEASAPRRVARAVGPRLRIVLFIVFGLLALIGANSGYLATVTALASIGEPASPGVLSCSRGDSHCPRILRLASGGGGPPAASHRQICTI